MSHQLGKSRYFIPCPVEDDDELFANGIFVFNITQLIRYLQSDESKIPVSEAQVKDFPRFGNDLDESYTDSTDLSQPVIVAEISPGRLNLIDGNHRMQKARKSGVASLPCYQVPPHLHSHFLTSKEAYGTFIDYWNDKLDEQEKTGSGDE